MIDANGFEQYIPPPPDERRIPLGEMFPEYDIDAILSSFPNKTVEYVANWILSTPNAPKKRRPAKRAADSSLSQEEDADMSDEEDMVEGLLLMKLLKDLFTKYNRKPLNHSWRIDIDFKVLLSGLFPSIRMDFFNRAYQHNHDMVSTMIACWFVYNKCTQQLQEFIGEPQHLMWLMTDPIQTRRRYEIDLNRPLPYQITRNHVVMDSINQFKAIMDQLSKKYPQILDGYKLLSAAFTLQIEAPEDVEMFECSVCFTRKSTERRIMCGNNESTSERHSFCRSCLRGHASAAAQDMPLAEGAVGLKCMEVECKNAIYYSAVRSLIPKEIRKRIDSRILEENIGCAGLNLERCRNCNYAAEMEQTVEENKVFDCVNCEIKWCRSCHRRWDDDHVGITCEEIDKRDKVDRKQRELEKKFNEVVVRRCHKCGLQFMKADGCNKMRCRCGATQCYVCKKQDIDYTHFCRHLRSPGDNGCKQCKQPTCLLWEDAKKRDDAEIDKIKASAGMNVSPLKVSPKTSDERNINTEIDRWQARDERMGRINALYNNMNRMRQYYGPEPAFGMPPNAPLVNVQIDGPANVHLQGNHSIYNNPFNNGINNRLPFNIRTNFNFQARRPHLDFQNQMPLQYDRDQMMNERQHEIDRFLLRRRELDNLRRIHQGNIYPENKVPRSVLDQRNVPVNDPSDQNVLADIFPRGNPLQDDRISSSDSDSDGHAEDYHDDNGDMLINSDDDNDQEIGNDLENYNRRDNPIQVEDFLTIINGDNSRLTDRANGNQLNNLISNGIPAPLQNEIPVIDIDVNPPVVNDDDEVLVVNEVRSPIFTAINRLRNGAPVYELAPVNEHKKYFENLVNDCNAILGFSVDECRIASEGFLNTVLNNNPELMHTETEHIIREFVQKQRELAEVARRQKEENQRLLQRLRSLNSLDIAVLNNFKKEVPEAKVDKSEKPNMCITDKDGVTENNTRSALNGLNNMFTPTITGNQTQSPILDHLRAFLQKDVVGNTTDNNINLTQRYNQSDFFNNGRESPQPGPSGIKHK